MSLVTCVRCGKRCQSRKASWWWKGSEKAYRCVSCTRKMLRHCRPVGTGWL